MLIMARSGRTKFSYELLGPDGPIGTLALPTAVPHATTPGARPADGSYVRITLPGDELRVEYQIVRQSGVRNDYRFRLMRELDELCFARGSRHRWEVTVGPDAHTLRNRSNLFRARFEILRNETLVGEIAETKLLALVRRDFRIDLPETMSDGVRAFVFFLAANAVFR